MDELKLYIYKDGSDYDGLMILARKNPKAYDFLEGVDDLIYRRKVS